MAIVDDAIVHSSTQVPPCQPKRIISRTEKPRLASAARRVRNPAISITPEMSSAALKTISPA